MRFRDFLYQLSLLLLTTLFVACSSDLDFPASEEMGRLQLAMSNVSVATRNIPADLGVPTAEDFTVNITNAYGNNVYSGAFTTEEISLPTGDYTVTASYGENSLLSIDNPYYLAEKTVTIEPKALTHIDLEANVGNALVSAIFGDTEENAARFDRFYSDYALYVGVGNFSIPISHSEASKSVYVRAGSNVTLRFWGKLKMENDREVQMTLDSPQFPTPINAKDHAIVTLSLPDPESAMTVAISKVELEEQTLDETIPLSWLPVAMVIPMHQYDRQGDLVGTNLIITESYPGKKWRAVITNAAGTITYRAVEGTGALQSEYSSDANKDTWPYLPQGSYKANYYLFNDDGTPQFASSRDFTIDAPSINIKTTGYTSYSKYLEGDITGANSKDRLTIYEPSVKLNVSSTLLNNTNYPYSFSYTYDGANNNVTSGSNIYSPGQLTGQAVQREPHVLRADATFDGVSVSAQREFFITGLPYTLNLQSHDEWTESGGVEWSGSEVRLGHMSTGSQYIQTTNTICIPPSTYFAADYSVNVHTLTVGTYLSIKVGDIEILKIEEGSSWDKDHLYSGTTGIYKDDDAYATSLRCYNDYGAGQTCSHIYSLSLKYAKP